MHKVSPTSNKIYLKAPNPGKLAQFYTYKNMEAKNGKHTSTSFEIFQIKARCFTIQRRRNGKHATAPVLGVKSCAPCVHLTCPVAGNYCHLSQAKKPIKYTNSVWPSCPCLTLSWLECTWEGNHMRLMYAVMHIDTHPCLPVLNTPRRAEASNHNSWFIS